MSDALSRQRLVELISDFLRWLPTGLNILPSVQYRRYRPFTTKDRDQAAAIVAGTAAFLPGDAVLIERTVDRFYGTIDRASIPPSENVAYAQVVLIPLRRSAAELAALLAEVRNRIKEPGNKPPKGKSAKRQRRPALKPKPLTTKQAEAVQIVGECKGDIAEAARRLGKDRKTVDGHYNAALKKMGKKIVEAATRPMPTDRRGQENVPDGDNRRLL